MTRPIRRDLLIHTVEHIAVDRNDTDIWEHTRDVKKTVERVRLEPTKSMVRGSIIGADGDKIIYHTILFWDAVNSGMQDFRVGDKIIHEGTTYTIDNIASFYDLTLHHLELRLI